MIQSVPDASMPSALQPVGPGSSTIRSSVARPLCGYLGNICAFTRVQGEENYLYFVNGIEIWKRYFPPELRKLLEACLQVPPLVELCISYYGQPFVNCGSNTNSGFSLVFNPIICFVLTKSLVDKVRWHYSYPRTDQGSSISDLYVSPASGTRGQWPNGSTFSFRDSDAVFSVVSSNAKEAKGTTPAGIRIKKCQVLDPSQEPTAAEGMAMADWVSQEFPMKDSPLILSTPSSGQNASS